MKLATFLLQSHYKIGYVLHHEVAAKYRAFAQQRQVLCISNFRVSRGETNAGVSLTLFYIINPRYSEHITRAKRECNDSLSDSGNWNVVNSDNWSALNYLYDRSPFVNEVSDIDGDISHVLSKFIYFVRAYWYRKAMSKYRFIYNIIAIIIARCVAREDACISCVYIYRLLVMIKNHDKEPNLKTNEISLYRDKTTTIYYLHVICVYRIASRFVFQKINCANANTSITSLLDLEMLDIWIREDIIRG